MTTRRRAREIVVQLLYEDDLNPEQDVKVAETFLQKRLLGNRPLIEFARELWKSVIKNRWEIDKSLSARAENWSLRRMAAIDRNILRLATYELLHTDTPGRVVINEAVELAKRYGNHQSGQFVNGILDRILHESQNPPEMPPSSTSQSDAQEANSLDGSAGITAAESEGDSNATTATASE